MNNYSIVKMTVLAAALYLSMSAFALASEQALPVDNERERPQNKTEPARRNTVIVPPSRTEQNQGRHENFDQNKKATQPHGAYRAGDRDRNEGKNVFQNQNPSVSRKHYENNNSNNSNIRASRFFSSPAPVRRGLRQPSRGHIWVDSGGTWDLVVAPQSDGPYIWAGDRWDPDYDVPAGYEWVPGYWGRYGWVAGHWVAAPEPPYSGLRWVSGYWNSSSIWVQGNWEGRHPHGRRWIPAHRSRNGYNWAPGRWR